MSKAHLSLLSCTLLLTGCIGQNPYITPVEERVVIPTPPPAGTLIPAEQPENVRVLPVYDVPSFTPAPTGSAAPQPAATNSRSETRAPVDPQSNTAVIALLGDARQSQDRGDLASAESQVERALRISPRDPQVYLELARLKRQQGEYLQAEQVALRGAAVAAAQPDYKRRLWLEVAEIRRASGDNAGAEAARAQADRY